MELEKTQRAPLRRTPRAGFSLVELMIVVTIVGILSAIAIPSFQSYIGKSRTAEAIDYLGAIKLREESYRSEFGQYCATTSAAGLGGLGDLADRSTLVPNPDEVADARTALLAETSSNTTATTAFSQMGMRFTEPLRFGYGVAAGTPAPDDIPFDYGWSTASADFWFIARAVADLDFDGDFITFETYSAARKIWIGADGNPAWASKGWD